MNGPQKDLRALINDWREEHDLRASDVVLELYAAASHYCPSSLADPIEEMETQAKGLVEALRQRNSDQKLSPTKEDEARKILANDTFASMRDRDRIAELEAALDIAMSVWDADYRDHADVRNAYERIKPVWKQRS